MAVGAARVQQDLAGFRKQGGGAFVAVRDGLEGLGCAQGGGLAGGGERGQGEEEKEAVHG
jgi:hypothetical protein